MDRAEAPPSSTYDRVPQVSAYARRERRRAAEKPEEEEEVARTERGEEEVRASAARLEEDEASEARGRNKGGRRDGNRRERGSKEFIRGGEGWGSRRRRWTRTPSDYSLSFAAPNREDSRGKGSLVVVIASGVGMVPLSQQEFQMYSRGSNGFRKSEVSSEHWTNGRTHEFLRSRSQVEKSSGGGIDEGSL